MKTDKTGLYTGKRKSAKNPGKSRLFGTGCFSMKRDGYNHWLSSFIRLLRGEDASGGVVRTEVIEGDELDLDSVDADTVRGRRVHIRSGARIRHLEYSETCEVEEGAQIGETVRVE